MGESPDNRIEREFREAEGRVKVIITDSNNSMLHFSMYGVDSIKTQGNYHHIPLHGSQNAVLTGSHIFHSLALARCIYPDGTPISLAPNKREPHCDI